MKAIIVFLSLALLSACGGFSRSKKLVASLGPERQKTGNMLGVEVEDLPISQELDEFDEIDGGAPTFKASVNFDKSMEYDWTESISERSSVFAMGPDGTQWEAYCGSSGEKPQVRDELNFGGIDRNGPKFVEAFRGFVSTPDNSRQSYDTHHGYSFNPKDVFIGKRENGRLRTALFFRDVGSHTTAPHYLAVDKSGKAHLAVADVNSSDDNSLDLYLVSGSPELEKWSSAYLVDRRGFTSVAHVWNGAFENNVHLLWSWDSGERKSPAMGLFHIEKTESGFGRKSRLLAGEVYNWSAAVDPESGRILVVFGGKDDLYAMSRDDGGDWTRPTPMRKSNFRSSSIELAPKGSGNFSMSVNDSVTKSTWIIVPEL